ncbi:phosphotransferase family protein [Microlunatus sp. GCM10028923]|uniref:phosphotransferase family protein n=1 Tax=Microlunatus sp. GCM10028923 TaxID=3273400 RepID=UPI00360BFE31
MDLTEFGTPTGPMTRVGGGAANRLYRLDTDRGSFAVKELNLVDRRWPYHLEDVFRFEQAAFAAGIPMPESMAAGPDLLVHRWVDGAKLPEAPAPPAYAFELGQILARLHALDFDWPHEPSREPTPRDWPELAERAAATGQPWADELAAKVDTFLAIADFVDTCERPGPVVLTHQDLQPWNLLVRDGRPVLLDWELSGRLDLSGELGSTALGLCKGPGLDHLEPASFRAVLDGYVAGGGTLPPPGPSWFVFTVSGRLGHIRANLVRCLAGVEAGTGPDLAQSQQIVRAGLHGLPDLFRRLPDLEALLLEALSA